MKNRPKNKVFQQKKTKHRSDVLRVGDLVVIDLSLTWQIPACVGDLSLFDEQGQVALIVSRSNKFIRVLIGGEAHVVHANCVRKLKVSNKQCIRPENRVQ